MTANFLSSSGYGVLKNEQRGLFFVNIVTFLCTTLYLKPYAYRVLVFIRIEVNDVLIFILVCIVRYQLRVDCLLPRNYLLLHSTITNLRRFTGK